MENMNNEIIESLKDTDLVVDTLEGVEVSEVIENANGSLLKGTLIGTGIVVAGLVAVKVLPKVVGFVKDKMEEKRNSTEMLTVNTEEKAEEVINEELDNQENN